MSSRVSRILMIGGKQCRVTLIREAGGYDYEVRDVLRPAVLLANGWTAGTVREALDEAQAHAKARL